MRIAVNALFLRSGRVGGSEIALRGLVRALAGLRPDDRIRVYVPAPEVGRLGFGAGVDEVAAPVPTRPRAARILGEQTWLPARLAKDRMDVLWNAGFTAPVACRVPQVTSIFDTQHLRHPEYFRPTHRLAWRVLVDVAIARSRRVSCPSAATRADLAALRPRHASKYRYVPLGVEDDWLAVPGAAERADWRGRFGLPDRFAVCVGTTHPHKGHATLLRAWRALLDAGPPPPPLVLTGVTGFADAAVRELVHRLELGALVRHLGWIARDDLRGLVGSAEVALVPSRFEGFGLPLLEAMALGTPTIASDLPVFREVGQELVTWVPAADPGAWVGAIRTALAMPAQERRDRAERARRAASAWTWERGATMLGELLDEVVGAARSVDGIESREV